MSEHDQPSARLRLAAELAVGLARRLWMTLHDTSNEGFCWHQSQTPFEDGCAVLCELGVALDTQQGFKFFPAPETRAGVLAYGELPDALFGRLLEAYVDTACDHGPDGTQLCSDPEPFKPTVEFEREIGTLAECGYAERCGDMVSLTAS